MPRSLDLPQLDLDDILLLGSGDNARDLFFKSCQPQRKYDAKSKGPRVHVEVGIGSSRKSAPVPGPQSG